jgi:hypothetical protein
MHSTGSAHCVIFNNECTVVNIFILRSYSSIVACYYINFNNFNHHQLVLTTKMGIFNNNQGNSITKSHNGRAANYCRTSDNVRLNLANIRAKVILIGHWSDQKNILSHYTFFSCDKIRLQIHSICILQ